jgi:pimeloyl-ACP methyl ester carboxylesterase
MDYCITVRTQAGDGYGDTPGPTSFLAVPDTADDFKTSQAIAAPADWVRAVLNDLGAAQKDPTGVVRRDLLVFIHGYNNTPPIVLERHRKLESDLKTFGFQGGVISFDWPSGDVALAYLNDREKAKQTAFALVRDCIELFARTQTNVDCNVNVHLLAHSTGAYVVQEAFDDADDRAVMASIAWTASQIVFIGGDISSASMANGDSETESIFRHCVRLTNYSNPYDEVLQLSNVKRIGLEPRVGRVGLPSGAPAKAVNVDCGDYYQVMVKTRDAKTVIGAESHSWQIGDPVFAEDLACTLNGDLDRSVIPTRRALPTGGFSLVVPGGSSVAASTRRKKGGGRVV